MCDLFISIYRYLTTEVGQRRVYFKIFGYQIIVIFIRPIFNVTSFWQNQFWIQARKWLQLINYINEIYLNYLFVDVKLSRHKFLHQRKIETFKNKEHNLTRDGFRAIEDYQFKFYFLIKFCSITKPERLRYLSLMNTIYIQGRNGTSESINKQNWAVVNKQTNLFRPT